MTLIVESPHSNSSHGALDYNETASTPNVTTVFYLILVSILLFKLKKQNDGIRARFAMKLQERNLKQIPAPLKLPLIGNLYMLREYSDNPWDGFEEIRKGYGDIVSLQMGVHPMVLVSNYQYMKEILLSKADIFANRPDFSRFSIIFGGDREHSLALCDWSEKHRVRRKFCKRGVLPGKKSDRNKFLESIITGHIRNLLSGLETREDLILNKSDILFLTGDIFLNFLCNDKYSHEDETYQKFNWCCDYVFYDINQSQVIDVLPYLSCIGVQHSYQRRLKTITDYCRSFIDDKIFNPRYLKHKSNHDDKSTSATCLSNDDAQSGDYLDQIINHQLNANSLMDLDDYKVGFSDLLAGHSAVANILMRVLGHVALDEEAQDMICAEARRAGVPELSIMPSLPVAKAALLEALRLASSPIVPHIARQDTSIGNYFVPEGTGVLFNIYHLNLSENLWDKPREFNIKHFLLEKLDPATGEASYSLNIPKHFHPFSIGLRQCLGFLMVQSISILAVSSLCERFKLRVHDEQLARTLLRPKGNIALNPMQECFTLELTRR